MTSPIHLTCLCGHEQTKHLNAEEYDLVAVTPGHVYCDFVYCDECLTPLAFTLPMGVIKRSVDRYTAIAVVSSLRLVG